MLLAFPWLVVSFGLYNAIAFGSASAATPRAPFDGTLASIEMVSGAVWLVSVGDAFIALTLLFLFIEVMKATRAAMPPVIDHVLSLALFGLCLVEFLVRREAATSVFFIMTLITLISLACGLGSRLRRKG
jgi:hypothetical protein